MIEKSILIVLPANEFNDREYLTVKKELERAYFKIFTASDAHSLCVGQNGLRVRADVLLYNINEKSFSAIVFIGGNGVKKYWNNSILHSKVVSFNNARKPIGAICSATVILAVAGLLKGKDATCYPPVKINLTNMNANYVDAEVVATGNIVTAQGSENAVQFCNVLIDKIIKRFATF